MKIKHISHLTINVIKELFSFTLDGKEVYSFELTNRKGMQLKVINFGATITSIKTPLKNGNIVDVVLGFDDLDSYIKSFDLESPPYFGATIGRFAGRINDGTFTLNDKAILLNKNNNNHSLHGGRFGFSQVVWKVKKIKEGKNPSITLTHFSPSGEENYPGDLSVDLTYTLSEENELIVEYIASTSEDTIVNLTHHSYFNLDGHQSTVENQILMVDSKKIVETDGENIPTGNFIDLNNHPFNFIVPKKCPTSIDNTFVVENNDIVSASLYSPKNNLKMDVITNQPGIHIYVGGNCFGTLKGKEDAAYHPLSGICFETQNFPDAPNNDHFPSSVIKKGELYHHKSSYKFQSL